MIKKIVIGILAILNTALLIMIIVSVVTGWHFRIVPSENSKLIAEGSSGISSQSTDEKVSEEDKDDEEEDYDEDDDDSENSSEDDDGEFDSDNDFVPGVTGEIIPDDDMDNSQNSEPVQSSIPAEESKSAETSKPVETSKPAETSKLAESSKPAGTSNPAQSKYPPASSMSTTDKAGLRDAEGFSWENGWTYLSPDAEQLTDYSLLTGGWKATMISDPFELRDSLGTDYFNVSLSGNASSAEVTINWGLRILKSVGTVDDSGNKSSLSGKFSNGKLTAVGSGSITIEGFFYDNGKEFAVGTYTWPDGVVGYIGLIRP